MDQLESLKNLWQNQKAEDPKFSNEELSGMLHKKSSSIVKWILIISILEFILPNIILFFTDAKATSSFYQTYGITQAMRIYTIIHFIIIIAFIYLFYNNYKNISADKSVKSMLKNILNTRKTVKYYIYYNIIAAAIIGIHIFAVVFNTASFHDKLPENISIITVWSIALVLFGIILFLFWLFYRLIYGFLLRKLQHNYTELIEK